MDEERWSAKEGEKKDGLSGGFCFGVLGVGWTMGVAGVGSAMGKREMLAGKLRYAETSSETIGCGFEDGGVSGAKSGSAVMGVGGCESLENSMPASKKSFFWERMENSLVMEEYTPRLVVC